MDLIIGALFIYGCIFAGRHAARHLRDDYRQSKDKALRTDVPRGAGGSRKRAAVRQHRAAWWAREIRHGLPVTRAGLNTGWLAHQTALAQTLAKREEARTSHYDAQASILEGLREHRKRQEEALERIRAAQQEPSVNGNGSGETMSKNGYDASQIQVTDIPLGGTAGDTAWAGNGGGEGSYTDVKQGAAGHASAAEVALADYQRQRAAAENRLAGMEAAKVDPATLADQADLIARLRAAEQAIMNVLDQAPAVGAGLTQRHGGLKAAHDDAPVRAADRGFYEEG